jgi:hypothetical protein
MPLHPEHERCRANGHAQSQQKSLLHFLMSDVLPAELTELVPLQAIRIVLFVLAGRIISLLTDRTGQIDNISHVVPREARSVKREKTLPPHSNHLTPDASLYYARISVTTPEPTVLPPSRTANRKPWSIAIGLINSPVTVTLSPGITISTPAASVTTPVTSVVRK